MLERMIGLAKRSRSPGVSTAALLPAPPMPRLEHHRSENAFREFREARIEQHAAQARLEDALQSLPEAIDFFCPVHGGVATLQMRQPAPFNWREDAHCPTCQINARVRLGLALVIDAIRDVAVPRVYTTEQATFGYVALKRRVGATIGSEYVDDPARRSMLGEYIRAISGDPDESLRFEDLTRLTFPDRHFDAVASFDVLEHIPDYRTALSEMCRVLRPGGRLVLTAPFLAGSTETLVRARIGADGKVEHLLTPEYHGDPVSADGALCFYHFGWDLLAALREAGFRDSEVVTTWSPAFGLLGEQLVITATR